MGQCKAGLEVDFVRVDTYQRSKRSHASRKPRSGDTVKTERKVSGEINVEARTDTGGSRSFSFSVKGEAEFRVTRSKRQSEDNNVSKPGSDNTGGNPGSDDNGSDPGSDNNGSDPGSDNNGSNPGSDNNGSNPGSDNNGSDRGGNSGNSGNSGGGGGGFGWRR